MRGESRSASETRRGMQTSTQMCQRDPGGKADIREAKRDAWIHADARALLRGMGFVYLSAFWSLAVQVDGLLGSRGILPAAELMDRARQGLGRKPDAVLVPADLALA